jgi:hypothetical protein
MTSDEIQKARDNKDVSKLDSNNMVEISDKIAVIKDLFQDQYFSRLFFDVIQSYIMHQEFDLAHIIVRHPTTQEERMDKLMDWIVAHKFWLFSLSGGVESVLNIVEESLPPMQKALKKD